MARLKMPRPDFLLRMVELGHIERSKVGVNIFLWRFMATKRGRNIIIKS